MFEQGLNPLVLRTRPRFQQSSIPEASSQTQTTHPSDTMIHTLDDRMIGCTVCENDRVIAVLHGAWEPGAFPILPNKDAQEYYGMLPMPRHFSLIQTYLNTLKRSFQSFLISLRSIVPSFEKASQWVRRVQSCMESHFLRKAPKRIAHS